MAVRSVFLSDLHLGWRLARPAGLAPLLLQLNPQRIYLPLPRTESCESDSQPVLVELSAVDVRQAQTN
jgi:hypothetical protein